MNREELWEAYSAGAENGYLHADEGEALTFDALREDFDSWLSSTYELWSMEELWLPVRAYNAFKRNGIETIGQVRKSIDEATAYLFDSEVPYALDIKNFGVKTLAQVRDALAEFDERQARRAEA